MYNNQQPGYSPAPQNNPVQPQQQQSYQAPVANQWPPMKVGNWIAANLLMLIPIANIILVFMWAFGKNVNPSKKSYFQAYLILMAVGVVLMIVLWGVLFSLITNALASSFDFSF